jgi:enamine deaminase RidA (YjgF/YER057c/UK114 family)
LARFEASQLGSPHIETEHLLLGLLQEDKALTNRFLRSDGPSHGSVESIRKQIEGHRTIREKVPASVDLPLANECMRVLAYAAEEAERLAHKHIGTEHLLLGLLREEKCFAAEILTQLGLRLPAIRESLRPTAPDAQDTKITERLSELGHTLPAPPAAGGNYLSAKRAGPILYLAGVISADHNGPITGTVGGDKTIDEAYAAARACALTQLAVIEREAGSLDQVESILSVNGYVNCIAGFPDSSTEPPTSWSRSSATPAATSAPPSESTPCPATHWSNSR